MSNQANASRRWLRWTVTAAVFVALIALGTVLNRPITERLATSRQALADAGYAGARVSRTQLPGNMARCEVGQIRNRGYAYAWRTDTHSGLYCLRLDGRPNRIIVD